MTDKESSRLAWRTALMTFGLAAALVFGIVVVAGGDWLPGTITVAASLVGLAGQVQAIGVTATRYMLFDQASWLQHTD